MKVRGDENPHWKRTKVPGDRPRPTPSRVHGCRFSPSPRLPWRMPGQRRARSGAVAPPTRPAAVGTSLGAPESRSYLGKAVMVESGNGTRRTRRPPSCPGARRVGHLRRLAGPHPACRGRRGPENVQSSTGRRTPVSIEGSKFGQLFPLARMKKKLYRTPRFFACFRILRLRIAMTGLQSSCWSQRRCAATEGALDGSRSSRPCQPSVRLFVRRDRPTHPWRRTVFGGDASDTQGASPVPGARLRRACPTTWSKLSSSGRTPTCSFPWTWHVSRGPGSGAHRRSGLLRKPVQ